MTKRLSSGLAFTPEQELRLFRRMALKGEHLIGTSYAGHGWEFEAGEEEDVIFDMVTMPEVSEDFFAMCKESGWTHVISLADTHIFKAQPGTVALHTDEALKVEALENQRNMFVKASIITALIFIAVCLLVFNVEWNEILDVVLMVAALFPVVYSVMPLIGYQTNLVKARKKLDA